MEDVCTRFIKDFFKNSSVGITRKDIEINLSQYSRCKCLSEILDVLIEEYKHRNYSITLRIKLKNIDISDTILEHLNRKEIELKNLFSTKIKTASCWRIARDSNGFYYLKQYLIIKIGNKQIVHPVDNTNVYSKFVECEELKKDEKDENIFEDASLDISLQVKQINENISTSKEK